MAKTPLLKILELTAIVDAQLHQFEPMDDETDYSPVSRPEMEKKKRNPLMRAAVASGTVAGMAGVAANADKIQAGYRKGKAAVTEAGRTAAFKGMRGTAGMMNQAGNLANRTAKKMPLAQDAAQKAGGALKKGAKMLKKKSMKFFNRDMAATMIRLDAKVRALGA